MNSTFFSRQVIDPAACEDLANRGTMGNVVYAFLWWMILYFTPLPEDMPVFSYSILAALLVASCGRAYYGFRFHTLYPKNPKFWVFAYHTSILGIAISMGIADAVVLYFYHDSWTAPAMGAITAGVVGGGTFSVGTHRTLQILFISFLMLPAFLTGLFVAEPTAVFLAVLHLIYFLYLISTGGRMFREYWRMHGQNILLEQRATQLDDARADAITASNAKSDFLANMSHEIRTPLNSIIGMSEMLIETELSAEQKEYVETFRSSGDLLLNLIDDILDFSKIEAGEMNVDNSEFDLFAELEAISRIFRTEATKKGLSFELAQDESLRGIYHGDSVKLKHVLVNLLGNSLKFTHQGGISISVTPHFELPGNLLFSVRDTGVGIEKEKQALIFDSFVQADTSTRRKFGGTGLGLAIVKRLTEIMGGRVTLESELGNGTEFVVSLPLSKVNESNIANNIQKSDSTDSRHYDFKGKQILLAEDSVDNQNVIRLYLKDTGAELTIANNGEEVLQKFDGGKFDVILMDIEMPIMDGVEAIREIRKREEADKNRTPIIALTAHSFTDSRERCEQAGSDLFLTKPVLKLVLLQSLRQAMESFLGKQVEGVASPAEHSKTQPKSPVRLNADFKELVPGFLERQKRDLEKLVDFMNTDETEEARKIAHKMKGASNMMEFYWLGSASASVEDNINSGEFDQATAITIEIRKYLDSVDVEYSEN